MVLATVWKLIIGFGCSQVAIQGDKVFVSYVEDKVDVLVSLDAATGDEYWCYDHDLVRRVEIRETYKAMSLVYGCAISLILSGEHLIVNVVGDAGWPRSTAAG